MRKLRLRFAFTLISTLASFPLLAQTDTEFWFVAPEVSESHADSPIVLRISSLSQPANVLISMPANPTFAAIGISIPANTSQTVDLTPFKSILENTPVNTILNRGILIQANNPVAAYYEVNASNNPDIFALKGGNAKGTLFYTPFQNTYDNGSFPVQPYSGFDIVATEDNTVVTVTPSVALNGHPAGVAFNVVLNRGQSYSCLASGQTAANHPTGSQVTATKPVCITIKDDSMVNNACRDLMGDQLVPVNVLGREYIVMRGFLSNDEHAYVLATENGTDVFVGGNASPVATLSAGQQYTVNIPTGQATTYITSNNPVYVLHVAGFGCEMGGAILPPVQCTGSSSVYFTRSTSDLFGLNIMVRNGSEGFFTLNGNSALVPASAFVVVPGTSNVWMAAQISFTTTEVPVGQTSVLVNTATDAELFHLGIINGGASTGCRYGYFSDFSSTNLGGNRIVCLGDTAELDAGPNKDSYIWNTLDTTQSIFVNQAGTYSVTTVKDGCVSSDTITVVKDLVDVDLGEDTTIVCDGPTVVLNAGSGFISYLWQDNSSDSTLFVNSEGLYMVETVSLSGCVSKDSVQIGFGTPPAMLNVNASTPLCEGETLTLSATGATWPVTWGGPSGYSADGAEQTQESIPLSAAGTYNATQFNGECPSLPALVTVVINPLPDPIISGDSILCEGETSLLTLNGGPFDSILWSNAGTTATIQVGAGSWSVNVSLDGCSASDVQQVHLTEPEAMFNVSPAPLVFLGTMQLFSDSSIASAYSPNSDYYWDFGDGSMGVGPVYSHTYADTGTYTVMFVVVNDEGCIDTIYNEINVVRFVVIPNAFSPNGDGFNDVFEVKYLALFPDSKLKIFNRWGKLLYSSNDYQSNWTGDDAPDGTYFYILDVGKGIDPYTGTVNLFRN
jgi:gliding motility-associated-like protein